MNPIPSQLVIDNGDCDEPLGNHSANRHFDDVLQAHLSRRSALKGTLGASIAALFGGVGLAGCATPGAGAGGQGPLIGFKAVPVSSADTVLVPPGYKVQTLDAIAQIRRECRADEANPFPVICGTSAGAINAAALACGANAFDDTVRRLVAVWENFHAQQVYRADWTDMLRSGARWLSLVGLGWLFMNRRLRPRSLLDNEPLRRLLAEQMEWERLPRNLEEGHLRALAVTASNYASGEHVTFYQSSHEAEPWVRNQRLAMHGDITIDHLLASAAIPFLFPAVALQGPHGLAYFGDGSMRQTAPISPAIHLGASRILVIGAGRMAEPPPPRQDHPEYPSLAQIAGHALSSIFLDTLAVDVERLRRINHTLSLMPPELQCQTRLRPIELLLIAPSQRLDEIAARHADALPATVRQLLQVLGPRNRGEPRQDSALLSYLLFEAAYTRELTALGRADAWRQREEMVRFFGW